jgi:hypothetical protein
VKRRREGTLEHYSATGEQPSDAEIRELLALGAVANLADFLDKAESRAEEMLAAGDDTLRAAEGRRLETYAATLRRDLAAGANEDALWVAVCAGLTFAHLGHELREDSTTEGHGARRKITRTKYFAKKRAADAARNPREKLAELLEVSPKNLRDWEQRNLE